MKKKGNLIGQKLVRAGIITAKQLKFILKEQRSANGSKKKERIGEMLLRYGFVEEHKLITFLEDHLGIKYSHLKSGAEIDLSAVKMIPEKMARQFKVIPLKIDTENNKLIVAMNNPFDVIALDTLKFKTGHDIERRFGLANEIDEAINKHYKDEALKKSIDDFIDLKSDEQTQDAGGTQVSDDSDGPEMVLEAANTPVVKFVDQLLRKAVLEGASDIHIEPSEKDLKIRYRIDGLLRDVTPPPKSMQSAIITRIKLLGDLDIAEHRLPQDGRYKFVYKNAAIDVRMASTPVIYGEKLVLRILNSASIKVKMEALGILPDKLELFKNVLKQAYGMILVTGPTGSGKTTTLYSALTHINTREKNIVTIEDPVEYQLDGINQIQTKHQIGLTFAAGLRTVLRQDPDIIMIGEIRDLETLENCVKASLTGHLVFSTLHTTNAPSAVIRLSHMGLVNYLISTCLSLVIAQRLVRKICENCKEKLSLPPAVLEDLEKKAGVNLTGMSFYQGKGCNKCNNSGYKGRVGLYEFFVVSPKIRKMILEEASEAELRETAFSEGMFSIFQDGLIKVDQGITSIEEILRVTVLEKLG